MIKRYRKNVGTVLMNADKKVFIAQRIDTPGPTWQMPQGGIDAGEDPRDAVFRELLEEIGTNHAEIVYEAPDWISYDLPKDLQQKLWGGGYAGQQQKWYLMRFLGQDHDINLNTEHPEFSRWQWVDPALIPSLAIDFKKEVYEQVLHFFASFLEPDKEENPTLKT
jgi:putative (di)nucleoside polyphosphate hydrolase